MEFESVMPALPVFTPGGYVLGNLVPPGPDIFADSQHGAVGKAQAGIIAQQALQQPDQGRQGPVDMENKVLVAGETEAVMVVPGYPVIGVFEGFVGFIEPVPEQDG